MAVTIDAQALADLVTNTPQTVSQISAKKLPSFSNLEKEEVGSFVKEYEVVSKDNKWSLQAKVILCLCP